MMMHIALHGECLACARGSIHYHVAVPTLQESFTEILPAIFKDLLLRCVCIKDMLEMKVLIAVFEVSTG